MQTEKSNESRLNSKGEHYMSNYFRITAYHPEKNVSAILDSNGYFEKLWQFSSLLVQKSFKIIEVGNEEKFIEGDLPKVTVDKEHIILRSCCMVQPVNKGNTISVNGKKYIVQ